MTDDPTAASDPARLPDPLDDGHEFSDHGGSQDEGGNDAGEGSSSHPRQHAPRPRGSRRSASKMRRIRRAKAGITQKLDFMRHLMGSLDVAIIVELCILYYMDCSFFGLLLRMAVQSIYLTPKDNEMLKLLPPPRPNMIWVYGANIFCMLMHVLFAPPEGSETERGYLHGGLIINLIGQKAPSSRFSLLLLDCVILALQCVNCAVWLEIQRVKKMESTLKSVSAGGAPKGPTGTAPAEPGAAAVDVLVGAISSTTQDLDAEERGVIRDEPLDAAGTDDIEMQPLVREQERRQGNNVDGRGILEARYQRIVRTTGGSDPTDGPGRPSLLDILMSGNGLLANLHVPDALRILMADSVTGPSEAGYPLRLTGYGTRIAQLAVQRARQQRA